MPCSRHSSETRVTLFACFTTAMICVSLNRPFFIVNLFRYLAEKIPFLNTTNFRGDYPIRTSISDSIIVLKEPIKKTNVGSNCSSYSLHHYSLQMRLKKANGKVNIFLLVKTAGTSLDQLDRFYIKNLEFPDAIVENLQWFGK